MPLLWNPMPDHRGIRGAKKKNPKRGREKKKTEHSTLHTRIQNVKKCKISVGTKGPTNLRSASSRFHWPSMLFLFWCFPPFFQMFLPLTAKDRSAVSGTVGNSARCSPRDVPLRTIPELVFDSLIRWIGCGNGLIGWRCRFSPFDI